MGIKEILAAKKAAAEALAASTPALASSDPVAHQQAITDHAAEQEHVAIQHAKDIEKALLIPPIDLPTEPPPSAPAVEKKLTFAEKMALKRGELKTAQVVGAAKEIPKAVIDPAMIPENPEDAQAYVDVKNKIEALTALLGDDLKTAMQDLQAALKKNAAACELMLDEDLGKMVIALRRMKNEDVVSATKPKKAGAKPKAKDVALTAEELEAAFNADDGSGF
jgi:hypothetical protein